MNNEIIHPLLNKASAHYNNRDGQITTIEKMESKYTIQQMIDWNEITIFKYEDRKDFKDQKESDLHKIQTHYDYMVFLLEIGDSITLNMVVAEVYDLLGMKVSYETGGSK